MLLLSFVAWCCPLSAGSFAEKPISVVNKVLLRLHHMETSHRHRGHLPVAVGLGGRWEGADKADNLSQKQRSAMFLRDCQRRERHF